MTTALLSWWTVLGLNSHSNPDSTVESSPVKKLQQVLISRLSNDGEKPDLLFALEIRREEAESAEAVGEVLDIAEELVHRPEVRQTGFTDKLIDDSRVNRDDKAFKPSDKDFWTSESVDFNVKCRQNILVPFNQLTVSEKDLIRGL